MEHRPDLPFGHSGLHLLLHVVHGGLAGVGRAAHRLDLVGPLDLAGLLHELGAILDGPAGPLELLVADIVALVDSDPGVGPTVLGDDIDHLGRHTTGLFLVA